ncbi:MAG: hypothetical protein JXR53_16005 [Bacteroidales bacterium]|nr:hypothetical protein [Bacteroidales bacterium]
MKKLILFLGIITVVTAFSVQAQSFKYTVKSSADCTNRTVNFTVPTGNVAKLMQMDIIASWTTCNVSQPAPTENWARVKKASTGSSTSRGAGKVFYKKTVNSAGHITESTPIQGVKLVPGDYVLEVSQAAGLEATLTIFLSAN